MFFTNIKRDLVIFEFRLPRMVLGLVIFLNISILQVSSAHEMWLEPIKYELAPGEKVLAHEKVGQNFKGSKYAYLDSSFKELNVTINNVTRPLKPRLGSLPAVQSLNNEEGLLVLSAITTPSKITYKDRAIFDKFLKEEGLDWVFEAHKERGLPEIGFNEVYRRYPKSLVKVGSGLGKDIPLGLPLEWVVIDNPYHATGIIRMKLLWKGGPYRNAPVSLFKKPGSGKDINNTVKSHLTTDKDGIVSLPVKHNDIYLINTVKMIEPDKLISDTYNAVWESLWASITFKVLIKK